MSIVVDANAADDRLPKQRLVRVAFAASGDRYVVPLGYVWVDGALWGTTRQGRKTRMAQADSRVAFTVDDSATATPFMWRSCVGEGHFEQVALQEFMTTAAARMSEVFVDNPEWNRREWSDGLADGSSVCWRVRPTQPSGRVPAYDPDSM